MRKFPELLVVFNISGSDQRRIEAFELYQKAFNAKSVYDIEPDESGEVHIVMEINGYKFGIFPGDDYNSRGNTCVQFEYDDENELRKVYDVLIQGASAHTMNADFWCKLHATVTDKYGVFWSLCVS